MRRTWSIRARTALVFAAAAMALAAGVVVFTNLMSISGAGTAYAIASSAPTVSEDGVPTHSSSTLRRDGTVSTTKDGATAEGDRRGALSAVRLVAVLQWQWSAVGIAGAGVVAGGVGWYVSRRMLRPIDVITTTANRITASNLHERIALTGPDDELRRLSRTVDDLLDRLETAFESQRRFVAQASHELRTPLAVQRAALQIGLSDDADAAEVGAVRAELLEQNRRTEHLVESLLVLAEADRGLGDSTEDLDLRQIAREVATGSAASLHDVTVTVTVPEELPAPVRGEPTLVRQLVVNLVANALEYNEPGGFVDVRVDADGLTVENSGLVVPAETAPLLVEPFRRCSRTSGVVRHSGLGLSIVASIAHAHGWRLEVSARDAGGLAVRVDVSPM